MTFPLRSYLLITLAILDIRLVLQNGIAWDAVDIIRVVARHILP